MRHLGAAVIGLIGTVLAVVLMGLGLGVARRALESFDQGPAVTGAGLLLLGGIALGSVVVARRLSAAAPLTGAVVLAALSVIALATPGALYRGLGLGNALGEGVATLLSLQIGAALAGVLLVTPLVGRAGRAPRGAAPPSGPAWPGPPPPGAPAWGQPAGPPSWPGPPSAPGGPPWDGPGGRPAAPPWGAPPPGSRAGPPPAR